MCFYVTSKRCMWNACFLLSVQAVLVCIRTMCVLNQTILVLCEHVLFRWFPWRYLHFPIQVWCEVPAMHPVAISSNANTYVSLTVWSEVATLPPAVTFPDKLPLYLEYICVFIKYICFFRTYMATREPQARALALGPTGPGPRAQGPGRMPHGPCGHVFS